MRRLPPDFLWGWATAATEVEGGGLSNSWTRWLADHAGEMASRAAAGADRVPVWDLVRSEACDPRTYRYGDAVDHWNRYASDYALAEDLGFNAGQITADWSRVETSPGRYDDDALDHYREMVRSMREHGQEPFVQLWHFADPLWLRDGWHDPQAPQRFAAYAHRAAEALGDLVRYWITINEPKVYTVKGFVQGKWPPGRRNPLAAVRAGAHLVRGHRLAANAIKDVQPAAQVGVPVSNVNYEAAKGPTAPADRLAQYAAHAYQNEPFRSPLVRHSDWVGLNYYVRIMFRHLRPVAVNPAATRRSDVGWDLVPGGIYPLLNRVTRYRKPIYVTEFGLADCRDEYRGWYVAESLQAIARAIADGADVRGAFHWSLLDNLEWDQGYWPRYGMVEVDRSTLARRPRDSAYEARDVINAMRGPGRGQAV